MKLFDCHCHFHLGPRGLAPLLQNIPPSPCPPPTSLTFTKRPESSSSTSSPSLHAPRPVTPSFSTSPSYTSYHDSFAFAGAAIMSTHPRDYSQVDECVVTLHARSYMAVPCYGIHPWFLHEVLSMNDECAGHDNIGNSGDLEGVVNKEDDWLTELRYRLLANPHAIVGEIGLDGARWRSVPDDDNVDKKARDKVTNNQASNTVWKYQKRMLSCPMKLQRQAFEQQLVIATELHRPVSIHVVQAWGELLETLSNVRELMRQRNETIDYGSCDHGAASDQTVDQKNPQQTKKRQKQLLLPPKIYFHAFSGKAGILPSLLAAIEKGNVSRDNVYFGFAPAIPNFYSSKTPSIMKQIGIHNLLLETDLEDSTNAWDDLNEGVKGIADALGIDVLDVVNQTYDNAMRFYFEKEAVSSQ